MKKYFLYILFIIPTVIASQTNREIALEKTSEAIELMDSGYIDESIEILKECQILDPDSFVYPYEIAYAYSLREEYQSAINILEKSTHYPDVSSQLYQMLGNCYSYLGYPEKAIEKYEQGMVLFPDSGNLHLEKGNVYMYQNKFEDAILSYLNGVTVDPMFPSNYYRLALYYLNTDNVLNGLIFGELFMNIERGSNRTIEMSEILYNTYQKVIKIEGNSIEVDFCRNIIIDASQEYKPGLCEGFMFNFIISFPNEIREINLTTLSETRSRFVQNYFSKPDMPKNVLFDYYKTMSENGVFDAYNHYIFQMGDEEAFAQWHQNNEAQYETFVDWYTTPKNILNIDKYNLFIGE